MNKQTGRQFVFATAVRQSVSMIIGLAGASSSGKTMSALKLARGLAGGDDSKIGVVDTESGRALHYAPAPGEKTGPERFAFQHVDLSPPFTPEAYIDAILAADEAGFSVIVVDSCSHEYDGEGGLQDIHDDLVAIAVDKARLQAEERGWSFNEAQAAEKASIGAWRDPKGRHRKFISRLLQCRAHLILCLRADEKMRMDTVEDDKGRKRTVIVAPKDMPVTERWAPICEKRMPYEMTLSLLLTPAAAGLPIPLKLQAQHAHAFPEGERLNERTGEILAAWARGGEAQTVAQKAEGAAVLGVDEFRKFWGRLSKADRETLKARLPEFQRISQATYAPDDPFAGSDGDPSDRAPAPNTAPETGDRPAPRDHAAAHTENGNRK